MEARRTLTENPVPKGLVVAMAVCAAIGLATLGAAAVKGLGASSSASTQAIVHPAAGTVLRQDDPVQGAQLIDRGAERSYVGAPAGSHVGRTSGNQFQDPSAAGGASSAGFEPLKGFRAQ